MCPQMGFRYCLMSAELRRVIISLDAVPMLLFVHPRVLLDLAAARAHGSSCATSLVHISQCCVCKAADNVSLLWGWRASFPGAGLVCALVCAELQGVSMQAIPPCAIHSPFRLPVEQDRSQDLHNFISNQPLHRAHPINHLA